MSAATVSGYIMCDNRKVDLIGSIIKKDYHEVFKISEQPILVFNTKPEYVNSIGESWSFEIVNEYGELHRFFKIKVRKSDVIDLYHGGIGINPVDIIKAEELSLEKLIIEQYKLIVKERLNQLKKSYTLEVFKSGIHFVTNKRDVKIGVINDELYGGGEIISTGFGVQIATNISYTNLSVSGKKDIAIINCGATLTSSGIDSILASAGDYGTVVSSGNQSLLITLGKRSDSLSGGIRSTILSLGDKSNIISTGSSTQHICIGNQCNIIPNNSGSLINVLGDNNVITIPEIKSYSEVCNIFGNNNILNIYDNVIFKAVTGTIINYTNGENISTSYVVGSDSLKENVRYRTCDGKIIEV